MNKPFGAQGEIINFPYKDLTEIIYNQDGIEIEVKDGILFIGVDDINKLDEAKDIAFLYLSAWSERQNMKIHVELNHTWKKNELGNQHHSIGFSEIISLIERVKAQITTHSISIQGTARIVTQQMHDSASFNNDNTMLQKAQKYPTLKSVLLYYSQEVIDNDRPLYGVYKALEAMTSYLDPKEKEGRKKLAGLVGKPFSCVDDVMQTTQVKRHHKTSATIKLNDAECRERAKKLIDAFANHLP